MDHSSWGDTTTQNDAVIKQYEKLPYPAFPENVLSREEKWYATNKSPLYIAPSDRLQKLNHYLYQGNESFQ